MDLMEYKAKELFAAGGLPVQKFAHIGEDILARGDAELVRAAAGLSYPAVVKAQVMTGGRGKAGGIKFAANETELIKRTREIIGHGDQGAHGAQRYDRGKGGGCSGVLSFRHAGPRDKGASHHFSPLAAWKSSRLQRILRK